MKSKVQAIATSGNCPGAPAFSLATTAAAKMIETKTALRILPSIARENIGHGGHVVLATRYAIAMWGEGIEMAQAIAA